MMAAFAHTEDNSPEGDHVGSGGASTCDLPEKLYIGFTTGYCTARLSILGMFLHAMWFDERARVQFKYTTIMQSISLFTIFVAFMVNIDQEIHHGMNNVDSKKFDDVYYGTVVFEFLTSAFSPRLRRWFHAPGAIITFYPMNINEVQERLGLLVLIVLGESFITLITVNPVEGNESRVISFLVCAFLMLCGFGMTFYDAVQRHVNLHHEGDSQHAMKRSIQDGALWRNFHGIVGLMLVLVGASLKGCYKQVIEGTAIKSNDSHLLAISCGCYILCCTFMRVLHKGYHVKQLTKRRVTLYAFYVLIALGHFMIYFVPSSQLYVDARNNYDSVLILHLFLSLLLNIGDVSGAYFFGKHFVPAAESDRDCVHMKIEKHLHPLNRQEGEVKADGKTTFDDQKLNLLSFVDFALAKEDLMINREDRKGLSGSDSDNVRNISLSPFHQ